MLIFPKSLKKEYAIIPLTTLSNKGEISIMANKKKLILDVDTGIDDAIGILLAVKSNRFDMLGITTV